MRLHAGRVYLTLGCDLECSLYAHGHLNLMRGRRHLGLQSVLSTLEPGHATRIALSLSHANLSAVHRALQRGDPVKAAVEVEAASGAERRRYERLERALDLSVRGGVRRLLGRWTPAPSEPCAGCLAGFRPGRVRTCVR